MKEILSYFIVAIFLLICSIKTTVLIPNLLGNQTLIIQSNASEIKTRRKNVFHNFTNNINGYKNNYDLSLSENSIKPVPCCFTIFIKTTLKAFSKCFRCCNQRYNLTINKIQLHEKKGCNLTKNQIDIKHKCCYKVIQFPDDVVVFMITITLAKLIIIVIAYQQLLHNGYIIISNLYYKRIRQFEILLCNRQYQQDGHGLGDEESYFRQYKQCQKGTSLKQFVRKKRQIFKQIHNLIGSILNKGKCSPKNVDIRNYSSVKKKQKPLPSNNNFQFYYKTQQFKNYDYYEAFSTDSFVEINDSSDYKQHRCFYKRDNPCYQGYCHQVEENVPIESIQNVKAKITFNDKGSMSLVKKSVVTAQICHTHIRSRFVPSLNTVSSSVCRWKTLSRKRRKRKSNHIMDTCNYFITNKSCICNCLLCNILCDIFSRCREYFHIYCYKICNCNVYASCCSCYCVKKINENTTISRATALNYNFFKNKVKLGGKRSVSLHRNNIHHLNIIKITKDMGNAPLQSGRKWCLDASNSDENETENSSNLLSSLNAVKAITSAVQSRQYKRKLKNNLVWLFIGLVWLEGPKLINCSINHNNNDISSVKGNETTNKIGSSQSNNNNSNGSGAETNSGGNNDGSSSNTNGPGPSPRPNATENRGQNVKSGHVFKTVDTFSQRSNSNAISYSKNYVTNTGIFIEVPLQEKKQYQKTENLVQRTPYFASESVVNLKLPTNIKLAQTPPVFSESEEVNRAQSDLARLESIKQQILSKLGLTEKPNVTHPLPKQFIWDTIYRADGIRSVSDFDFNNNHRLHENMRLTTPVLATPHIMHHYSTIPNNVRSVESTKMTDARAAVNSDTKNVDPTTRDSFNSNWILLNKSMGYDNENEEHVLVKHHLRNKQKIRNYKHSANQYKGQSSNHNEPDPFEGDDFFGSTQEIITFAEKGTIYKRHRLVEFSPPSNKYPKQKLQIRNAEIHIRIEKVTMQLNKGHLFSNSYSATREPKLKIWVFQLIGNDFSGKGFDQVATLCTSLSVDHNVLGWQKLDITETVQFWYGKHQKDKLRLLIDCTGCGNRYILHLFDRRFHQSVRPQSVGSERQISNRMHKNKNSTIFNNKHLKKTKNQRSYYNYRQYNPHAQKPEFGSSFVHFNKKINASKIQIHKYRKARNLKKTNNIINRHESMSYEVGGEYHLEDRLNPNRPFLVLHTEPIRSRRVRRRAVDCSGAFHGQCCKESFYVSFKALGWDDWIIAPRGYFANYCRGDCTGPYRTPDTFQTFHAHFIEEYRKMGLLNGMQPCCAPVKFSSMSLIYYGDDGIIKRDLPKMVVDECGCP